MNNMASSVIEQLNRILTNTLIYKGKLKTLSERSYSEETNLKMKDFAKRRTAQANELIQIINELGGQAESTPQHTDAEKISWCAEILPKDGDTMALLKYLISAEKESLNDYRQVMEQINNRDIESKLQDHIQQGEVTLKYLKVALDTNRTSEKT